MPSPPRGSLLEIQGGEGKGAIWTFQRETTHSQNLTIKNGNYKNVTENYYVTLLVLK